MAKLDMAAERASKRLGLHRVAWAAGFIGLPLSHYWLLAKVEPFYSSIYCFLWWSYILAVDFAVYRLRGASLLRDRPREFLFLAVVSVPLWMLFEAVNLRIQNWYYVMVPVSFSWGAVFLLLAFGTVLPGIFETMELVVGVIEKVAPHRRVTGRPFTITLWNIRLQWAIGVVMLVLLLMFPEEYFCLAWGFAFFLTEPISYWRQRAEKDHVGRSLLGQLAAGDNTRLVALLVAGLITGALWESWNITARTKWIYSVPYFDDLKLGEMPVLGFLGFPPFALECYALVNFLALLRGGRHWERISFSETHRTTLETGDRSPDARPIPLNRGMPIWGWVAASFLTCAAMLACLQGAAGRTVASADYPLTHVFARELGHAGIQALRERNATQGHLFLRLTDAPPEIPAPLFDRMRRLVILSECKGMGIVSALALEKLNIRRLDDLAAQDPAGLAQQLTEQCQLRRVRTEEVKIWINEAKVLSAAALPLRTSD
jgi:hypothetical protein